MNAQQEDQPEEVDRKLTPLELRANADQLIATMKKYLPPSTTNHLSWEGEEVIKEGSVKYTLNFLQPSPTEGFVFITAASFDKSGTNTKNTATRVTTILGESLSLSFESRSSKIDQHCANSIRANRESLALIKRVGKLFKPD